MFTAALIADRGDQIRSLCAGLSTDELPDSVVDQDVYSGMAALWVNEMFPTYLSLSPASKLRIHVLFCRYVAMLLCKTYCKSRRRSLVSDKTEFQRDPIDWDLLSDGHKRFIDEMVPSLIPAETPDYGLVLVPSATNPITGLPQDIIY